MCLSSDDTMLYYFTYFMGDIVEGVSLTTVVNSGTQNVMNFTTVLLLGC
jgi:hypothetical protein